MRIVIRTYRKRGKVTRREWWVMSADGFPLGCGSGMSRRQCYTLARSAADQWQAERQEWIRQMYPNPLT